MEIFKKVAAFRGKDLKRIYGNYYTVLLNRMIKRGIIRKLIRGWYTFYDDPIIYSWKPFFPCYYSLEFALSFYGYYEQFVNIQIVTTRKYGRKEVVFSDGTKVFLFKISKKLFFGYKFIDYEGFKIPMVTKEKTFGRSNLLQEGNSRIRQDIFGERYSNRKVTAYLEKNKKQNFEEKDPSRDFEINK